MARYFDEEPLFMPHKVCDRFKLIYIYTRFSEWFLDVNCSEDVGLESI